MRRITFEDIKALNKAKDILIDLRNELNGKEKYVGEWDWDNRFNDFMSHGSYGFWDIDEAIDMLIMFSKADFYKMMPKKAIEEMMDVHKNAMGWNVYTITIHGAEYSISELAQEFGGGYDFLYPTDKAEDFDTCHLETWSDVIDMLSREF